MASLEASMQAVAESGRRYSSASPKAAKPRSPSRALIDISVNHDNR
jgi:hypothetical protein